MGLEMLRSDLNTLYFNHHFDKVLIGSGRSVQVVDFVSIARTVFSRTFDLERIGSGRKNCAL
jgi:hypothetical protein